MKVEEDNNVGGRFQAWEGKVKEKVEGIVVCLREREQYYFS